MARKTSVVEIPYERLVDPLADLTEALWRGFGPDGLGIVTVSGVPDFSAHRDSLLPLAQQFADLPGEVKQSHEHAASSFNVGWSHGKEALRSGIPDTHKGSFYANPLQDTYDDVDHDTAAKYSSYYSPNIWPRDHLPQLEQSFKQLGRLVIDVGLLLAQHCSNGEPLGAGEQAQLDFAGQLRSSSCHKARLLHYFPTNSGDQQQQQVAAGEDWCGWHLDHGALTGGMVTQRLTSAMYIKEGQQVACPDPSAACTSVTDGPGHGDPVGGLLRATPHCVRAAAAGGPGVSRNTFGEFAEATMHGYYSTSSAAAAAAAAGSPTRSPAAGRASGADATPTSAKDVAPASVLLAAESATRKRLQLLVSHE
ncbi:hypothetical protein COO60DRAFT_1702779 [Scenedesmus sp. NREL 46B-D3]|nr:hypothetical protein COO60DRAFT_1702779 [Scenedesmus sp. NREL 46B-D3]